MKRYFDRFSLFDSTYTYFYEYLNPKIELTQNLYGNLWESNFFFLVREMSNSHNVISSTVQIIATPNIIRSETCKRA